MAVLKHYSYNGSEISIDPTVVILEAKDGGALAYWDRTEFSSLEMNEQLTVMMKMVG